MSEEAKYEQWLDAAIACEANSMSAEEEHAFALEASLKQEEYEAYEEYEEWLDSTLGLQASLTSPYSALELPEEIPDNCETWWPKSSDSRAHRRVLRLRGLQGYERVRQKLWKGARTMASRFRRLYCACAPKRSHAPLTGVRTRPRRQLQDFLRA